MRKLFAGTIAWRVGRAAERPSRLGWFPGRKARAESVFTDFKKRYKDEDTSADFRFVYSRWWRNVNMVGRTTHGTWKIDRASILVIRYGVCCWRHISCGVLHHFPHITCRWPDTVVKQCSVGRNQGYEAQETSSNTIKNFHLQAMLTEFLDIDWHPNEAWQLKRRTFTDTWKAYRLCLL